MELLLERIEKKSKYTVGRLCVIKRVDDEYLAREEKDFLFDTLEPKFVQINGGKRLLKRKAAIPPRTYYEKHKCTTISRIIRRWAPETENQVEAYIRTVSKLTGIGATTPLPPMKEETKVVWCDLVLAMATVECGLNSQSREELAPSIDVGWRLLNP